MVITTKPCVLPGKIYMKECLWNIIKTQWWLNFIVVIGIATVVYFKIRWVWITLVVLYVLYVLFLLLQLYAVRIIPGNKIMFGKLYFDFYDDKIIMHTDHRLAAQFFWASIQKVKKREKYYLFFFSKIQVLYIPKNSFNSPFEQQMFENLLASSVLTK